jgi:hypothetical protein
MQCGYQKMNRALELLKVFLASALTQGQKKQKYMLRI